MEINLTDKQIRDYFRVRLREMYYSQIKKECILWLRKKYKLRYIADLIYGNPERHDTICHFLNHKKDIQIDFNWWEMIEQGLYPITVQYNSGQTYFAQYELINYEQAQVYSKAAKPCKKRGYEFVVKCSAIRNCQEVRDLSDERSQHH